MNYLLDTSAISDFFKKYPGVVQRFASIAPVQIHISAITVMEIEYGLCLNAVREAKIRPLWVQLLKCIQVVPYCTNCASETSLVRSHLKTRGLLIGPYDILIAGTALAHQMCVVTSNSSEFERIPGLSLENWR